MVERTNPTPAWDDDEAEATVTPLTREQAQAYRDAHPPVSPWRVVAAQAAVGVAVAAAAWLMGGDAAWVVGAVRRGGGGGAGCADGARHDQSQRPAVAAGRCRELHVWEVVKIGVSVLMLMLAPKVVQPLSWPALLVGLVLCMKVYWLALLWRGVDGARGPAGTQHKWQQTRTHPPPVNTSFTT